MCFLNNCIDFGQNGREIKDRLLKYYPLRDYHVQAFFLNHLFFAFPSRMNDCYDTSSLLIDPFPKFKAISGWCPEMAEKLDLHGICSFIEAPDVKNGWMWSFYANNYNGFVIEYDPNMFNEYPPLHLMPVKYLDNALNLDDMDLRFKIHKDEVLTLKDFKKDGIKVLERLFQCLHLAKDRKIWGKENEWRAMIGEIRTSKKLQKNLIRHQDGYLLNIKDDAYKALYIGYKIPKVYRQFLVCIAKNKGMKTFLVTPKLVDCKWDMEVTAL